MVTEIFGGAHNINSKIVQYDQNYCFNIQQPPIELTQRRWLPDPTPINVSSDKDGAPNPTKNADENEKNQFEEIPRVIIIDEEHDSLKRYQGSL